MNPILELAAESIKLEWLLGFMTVFFLATAWSSGGKTVVCSHTKNVRHRKAEGKLPPAELRRAPCRLRPS